MESPLSNTPFDLRRGGRRVLRLSPKRWEGPGSGVWGVRKQRRGFSCSGQPRTVTSRRVRNRTDSDRSGTIKNGLKDTGRESRSVVERRSKWGCVVPGQRTFGVTVA